jgi:MFS family permease
MSLNGGEYSTFPTTAEQLSSISAAHEKTVEGERRLITFTAAFALFVDFALLTVVVPIFPAIQKAQGTSTLAVGFLFAAKPIVQLVADPLLAPVVDRGANWPLVAGLALEAATAVVFACADSYEVMVLARALQGIASAGIMTTGMALVARVYGGDDEARGVAMSRAFMGVAVGVSVGPPLGGALFEAGRLSIIPLL